MWSEAPQNQTPVTLANTADSWALVWSYQARVPGGKTWILHLLRDMCWGVAEELHSRLLCYVCMGGQGSPEGGSLSPPGPSHPAFGHPGWEHSLTWAGPARRRAGCQAQNLPGVSHGCGASFQRPLIIQRNSLSFRLFPLPPPMHTPPHAPHADIHNTLI